MDKPNIHHRSSQRLLAHHRSRRWYCLLAGLLLVASRIALGAGALSALNVNGLAPAFTPNIHNYSMPDSGCVVPVSATLSNPTHNLYIQSGQTNSGSTVNAWVCDGHPQLSIVVYQNWVEMGRYTVYKGSIPADVEEPDTNNDGSDSDNNTDISNNDGNAGNNTPYSPQPTADAENARFLSHASFGASPAALAELNQLGSVQSWLAQQFTMSASPLSASTDVNALRGLVFENMVKGQDQLRQRMIFALSQIIVVSSNKNIYGNEMLPWLQLLSAEAFGNYRNLLYKLSINPSLGKYLDHANSRKASAITAPNENYPRELMQLFSIGLWKLNADGSQLVNAQNQPIPTYSQSELAAVARALTGWTYPTAPNTTPQSTNWEYFVGNLESRPVNHDMGIKYLPDGVVIPANQSPEEDLDAVIDWLFNHPNVGPFLATRLIRLLVTSNPSANYIQRVAAKFDNNGNGVRGDLKAVLTAVLTDAEALDPSFAGARLKDPLVYFMNLARALSASIGNTTGIQYLFANLSQQVITAPSVFGFYLLEAPLADYPGLYGPEFQIYPPSLAIHRANMVYQLLTGQFGSAMQVNIQPYVSLAGDVDALLQKVNNDLLQGTMSSELYSIIHTATEAVADPTQRAIGALYLTAISGEFEVQK